MHLRRMRYSHFGTIRCEIGDAVPTSLVLLPCSSDDSSRSTNFGRATPSCTQVPSPKIESLADDGQRLVFDIFHLFRTQRRKFRRPLHIFLELLYVVDADDIRAHC